MKRIRQNLFVLVFMIFNEYYFCVIANEFQCYVCSSDKLEACSMTHQSNKTELPIQSCPPSVSSCFLKIENGITYRGCMSNNTGGTSLINNNCDNSKKCTLCQSNNCNGHSLNLKVSLKKCIICDSKTDPKCINELNSTHTKECKKDDDQCFTHIDKFNIKRGCLSDQSPEFMEICQKDPKKCSIFNKDNCNDNKIVLETCIDCNSVNDEKCKQKLNSNKGKICSTLDSKDTLGCFLSMEPKLIWGCVRDLYSEVKNECLNQVDSCKTCAGNDCNSMTQFQSCYYNNTDNEAADSTVAAVAPQDSNNVNGTRVCKKFDDKCFTLISKNDVIVKDCLYGYAESNNISVDFLKKYDKSLYDVCSTPLCNKQEIRPMYCIACDSTKDKNCNSLPLAQAKKCPLEMTWSGCFHRTDGQNTQRGCIAELKKEMRITCESDSNECKKCTENVCNSRLFFQKCVTENLKVNGSKKGSKLCRRYSDECFIHVTVDNEIVRRGCKREVIESPEKEIDLEKDCKNSTICELCSTKIDCNNREVVNELCIDCKSKRMDTCSNAPNKLKPTKCPLTLKKQGCYLMHENLEKVQRGCISHLDKDDRNNCSPGNSTCKMCLGDECNAKPTFQTCYSCTSETDRHKCINSPKLAEKIICSNYMDHCYTTVKSGCVIRGCTGDKIVPSVQKCSENSEICKHCSADGPCNIQTFKPITCVTCNSSIDPTCATNVTFETTKLCSAYLDTQRCYHFINKTTAQHIRGCVADLEEPIKILCSKDSKSDECRTCVGSKCNTKQTFSRCLHCDSALDPECAINPDANIFSKVCNAYEDKCYLNISKFSVKRGCLAERKTELGEDDKCTNPRKCVVCTETHEFGCNNRTIVMETCVDCDTNNGDNCYDDLDKFKGKICSDISSTEKQGCYLSIEKHRTARGCVRDLNISKQLSCFDRSDFCKTCMGKDCNLKRTFQQCIDCNSKYNLGCLGNETDTWSQCDNYLSTCITGIDAHGFTHRRCSKDYERDSLEFPNKMSVVCTRNKCNNDVYPPNRLECYVCDGKRDCDFMPTTSPKPLSDRELKPCNIFSVYDQCYAFLSKHNHVYRGCLSDSSDHRLLCDQDQNENRSCITCEKSGCNDTPKIRPPTSSCIQCSKSSECTFGFEKDSAASCKEDVRLGLEESCYTYYRNSNETIERGCTLDRKRNPTTKRKNFEMCESSGCNRFNKMYSSCVLCDSEKDSECYELSDSKNFTKECQGTYTYSKRGCYTFRQNDTLTRGCIKDLDSEKYEICKNEKDKCHLCVDHDSCNTSIPGKSTNLSSNGFLIVIVISFVSFLRK